MKQPLQGMERAGRKHLDRAQYWNLSGKAAAEGHHIREHLIPASVERGLAEGRSDGDEAWNAFAAELTAHYTGTRQGENAAIMNRARNGEYEREAPTQGSVSSMLVAFCICVAIMFVFAIQGLIRDTLSGAILLLITLLIIGSAQIGYGMRRILDRSWYKAYLAERSELATADIANLASGVVLIGLVAFLRAYGMSDPLSGIFQFILTIIAGSACACCATRFMALRAKRDRLLDLEGQAQTWFASTEHADRLDEYKYVYCSQFEAATGGGTHAAQPHLSAAGV